MPNLDNMLGFNGKVANLLGTMNHQPDFMTGHRPVSITIARLDATLDAQTVTVMPSGTRASQDTAGQSGALAGIDHLIVLGESTLDIARADRFRFSGATWEVIFVDSSTPGMIQARCKAVQ